MCRSLQRRVTSSLVLGAMVSIEECCDKILINNTGEGNGQFNAPTGVAVDSQDNILVADWGNSRIQVLILLQYNVLII